MLALPNEPGHLLGGEIDKLDAEEGRVDEEVPTLVVHQVIVLDGAHAGQLLLHRHLLAELHGRQHLFYLDIPVRFILIYTFRYSAHLIS